jgi:hypothetical protein
MQHEEMIERGAWKSGVLGALNLVAMVLAARLIVLVAVLGGILLTWQALADPVAFRVLALGVYGGLIVLPSIWLSSTGRG